MRRPHQHVCEQRPPHVRVKQGRRFTRDRRRKRSSEEVRVLYLGHFPVDGEGSLFFKLPSYPSFFFFSKHLKMIGCFLKSLQNALTSSNYLGVPAIPAKFRKDSDDCFSKTKAFEKQTHPKVAKWNNMKNIKF